MAEKLTRRELAAALSAPALLAPALVAQSPTPPPLPQNADDELKAVRDQNRQISEALTRFSVPMATEPAVHFKA